MFVPQMTTESAVNTTPLSKNIQSPIQMVEAKNYAMQLLPKSKL